ncbi:MAG: cupin [Nitrospirota bacterium]|nr:cupin [Nitrospirota bacterium]
MTTLTISPEENPTPDAVFTDFSDIQKRLEEVGVLIERWQADRVLGPDADQDSILAAYADPVARLKKKYNFASADVIAVGAGHPQKDALRAKFLQEHTHSDYEVRFFVEGCGLFFLHPDHRVYGILCERGDLLSVPAGARHWFDLGATPNLRCVRLFTTPEGWVADYTGSDIAKNFPTLEQFQRAHA